MFSKKIDPRGSIYNQNREGAKIEPCGRPQGREAVEDKNYPSLTTYFLSDKNDWNHFKTVPERATQDFSLLINTEWLMVSKAADKSKRTRTTESPVSVAKKNVV